jgi:DNA-binding phage protein
MAPQEDSRRSVTRARESSPSQTLSKNGNPSLGTVLKALSLKLTPQAA